VSLPTDHILAEAGAFILVVLLTAALRRAALAHRLVDHPGRGKAHQAATPYLGGVAIAAGSLVAAGIAGPPRDPRVLTLIAAGITVAVLGLADDLRPLNVPVRLLIEGSAAALAILAGARAGIIGPLPYLGQWPDYVMTLAWIVVITNSFNLLDNSDGAAAGVAMVTCGTLAVLAFSAGRESMGIIQLALSAGCAGFLVWNWAPASIFMGDAGSLFLGFMTSVSALFILGSPGVAAASSRVSRAGGLLLLAFVALVDTGTVVMSRYWAGIPLFRGGTDHAAHRLRALGLETPQCAVLLSAAAVLSGVAATLVVFGTVPAAAALAITLALAVILVALAQRVPVYHMGGAGTPGAAHEAAQPALHAVAETGRAR
jgi:UDP-GlcNAc:undecaprenyl-phosphate/decaprenyl-phosphate GlcNAc-1-phosphate transferase